MSDTAEVVIRTEVPINAMQTLVTFKCPPFEDSIRNEILEAAAERAVASLSVSVDRAERATVVMVVEEWKAD